MTSWEDGMDVFWVMIFAVVIMCLCTGVSGVYYIRNIIRDNSTIFLAGNHPLSKVCGPCMFISHVTQDDLCLESVEMQTVVVPHDVTSLYSEGNQLRPTEQLRPTDNQHEHQTSTSDERLQHWYDWYYGGEQGPEPHIPSHIRESAESHRVPEILQRGQSYRPLPLHSTHSDMVPSQVSGSSRPAEQLRPTSCPQDQQTSPSVQHLLDWYNPSEQGPEPYTSSYRGQRVPPHRVGQILPRVPLYGPPIGQIFGSTLMPSQHSAPGGEATVPSAPHPVYDDSAASAPPLDDGDDGDDDAATSNALPPSYDDIATPSVPPPSYEEYMAGIVPGEQNTS